MAVSSFSQPPLNKPVVISGQSFQQAWKDVVLFLSKTSWETYNLVVQIDDPVSFDQVIHKQVINFCGENSLLSPKDVAYTIFPHNQYRYLKSGNGVYNAYNKSNGLYERLQTKARSGWGTYFRRMTHYKEGSAIENQLKNIVDAINKRKLLYKAAYTIIIQKPGSETIRALGGPCLNYMAIQLYRDGSENYLGMMCVYRNHDFLGRAYGNYWGLCNLVWFLSNETGYKPGIVTIISSHAYIDGVKARLKDLISKL